MAASPCTAAGHLYVADTTAGLVYRFPLGADGLPKTTPDATLSGGLTSPFGLAFDRAGNIFVSDEKSGVVNVYPPGSTGDATPARQISVGTDWVGFVGVDRRGDVFVNDLNVNAVYVYAPGSSGRAAPLRTLSIWGQSNPIRDFILDSAGRLYVTSYSRAIDVFDDPVQQWNHPDHYLFPEGGYEWTFLSALALDDAGHVYLNFSPKDTSPPYAADDFAVRRLPGYGSAGANDALIMTKDCRGSGHSPGTDVGAAVNGSYLMFTCVDRDLGVMVYKAAPGEQKLVEKIGATVFRSVGDVKIGP
jgi:hypothetical protein